jgi:two-component system chemotaxis response regulator CheB
VTSGGKIRVLVVDDSSFNRKVISEILDGSGDFEVVAKAFDGEDAISKILRFNPDALTLDLEMPRMDGFAVLRWLMANRPLPVVVVSARESDRSVFKALDLGAVDFVVKPSRLASPQLKLIEEELLLKMRALNALQLDKVQKRLAQPPPSAPRVTLPSPRGHRVAGVVAIAASTGGPPAVQRILMGLDPAVVSPILICQHMPPVFTKLFAERLMSLAGRVVKEAADGDKVLPRNVYVAPGGHQLMLTVADNQQVLSVRNRRPEDRFAPSANHLLSSVAKVCGKYCLAVVLTGMGDDGKEGAVEIHGAGGIVVAESEASAVIFGMPKEVIRAGAADHVDDLDGITGLINRHALLDEAALQTH